MADKLMHPISAVKQMMHKDKTPTNTNETGATRTVPTNMVNEEQLNNQLGGTPTLGTTAASGARTVYSETMPVGTGHHTGMTGATGVGATGLAGYEAEKHLGHHGQHTGHVGQGLPGTGASGMVSHVYGENVHGQHTGTHMGQGITGTGVTSTGTTGLGHYGHHTGTHIGEGVAGAGVVGAGVYEAERHHGQHHGHHNDASILADNPGLPGTTGVRGEVYKPNQPRPQNVGLNIIGANTPLNTSDYRTYDKTSAEGNVTRSDLASQGINEERIEKTSLPANPLMSALTGGKIPPSIHEGAKQAGLHGGEGTGSANRETTHTSGYDIGRTGGYDTTTTRTGVYDTTRRDVI